MKLEVLIIFILSAYGFASAVEITPFPGKLLGWLKRHKPFSCFLCLAFWFSFFFAYCYYQLRLGHAVFLAFMSCGGATFLKYIELRLLPMNDFKDIQDIPVNISIEERKE